MRAVLILFEPISGLKVNFTKSQLVGVNVHQSWLTEAALVMRCRVGSLPFVYLGLPIGGNARLLSFWEPLLLRIKSRLSAEVRLVIYACLCSFFFQGSFRYCLLY